MNKKSICIRIYRYFLDKFKSNYRPDSSDDEVLTNFLLELHKSIGLKHISKKYLFEYITYQFYYKKDSKTEFNKYSVKNIFGVTPLRRFLADEKKRELIYIDKRFLTENKIYFSEIFKEKAIKLDNSFRTHFHNTPAGLAYCLETTSLYNSSIYECMVCNFKEKCKSVKEKVNV